MNRSYRADALSTTAPPDQDDFPPRDKEKVGVAFRGGQDCRVITRRSSLAIGFNSTRIPTVPDFRGAKPVREL